MRSPNIRFCLFLDARAMSGLRMCLLAYANLKRIYAPTGFRRSHIIIQTQPLDCVW